MNWLILISYIIFLYGCSIIVTQGVGPFNILIKWRAIANNISDNFGLLFRCMLCFPTNLGIICSLINWFFIPVMITPFNMAFSDIHDIWYYSIIACIMDGAFAGGIVSFIYNIYDYIDKSTPIFEDEVPHYEKEEDEN